MLIVGSMTCESSAPMTHQQQLDQLEGGVLRMFPTQRSDGQRPHLLTEQHGTLHSFDGGPPEQGGARGGSR